MAQHQATITGAEARELSNQWESLCSRMRWADDDRVMHLEGFLAARGLLGDFLICAKDAAAIEDEERTEVELACKDGCELAIVFDFEGEVVRATDPSTQEDVDIEDLDIEKIGRGVALRLDVTYPRANRYGVPLEATQQGGERWTKEMGYVISEDFEVWPEDSGDDSSIQLELLVRLADGWKKG